MPLFVVFGALSDRIGRKKLMMAGCLLAALTLLPDLQGDGAARRTTTWSRSKRVPDQVTGEIKLIPMTVVRRRARARADRERTPTSSMLVVAGLRPGGLRDDGLRPDRGVPGRSVPREDPLHVAVAALPHRQRRLRRAAAGHRADDLRATGNIYAGLIYPIVVALLTFIVGTLFLKETRHMQDLGRADESHDSHDIRHSSSSRRIADDVRVDFAVILPTPPRRPARPSRADDELRARGAGGVEGLVLVVQQHAMRAAAQELHARRQRRRRQARLRRRAFPSARRQRLLAVHAAVRHRPAVAALALDDGGGAGVELVGVLGEHLRVRLGVEQVAPHAPRGASCRPSRPCPTSPRAARRTPRSRRRSAARIGCGELALRRAGRCGPSAPVRQVSTRCPPPLGEVVRACARRRHRPSASPARRSNRRVRRPVALRVKDSHVAARAASRRAYQSCEPARLVPALRLRQAT